MNSLCIGKIEVSLNKISLGNPQHLLKDDFKIDFCITNNSCNMVLYTPPHAIILKDRRD